MSPSWITFLTFISATLMAACVGSLAYDYFFRYRAVVRQRLNEICTPDTAHELSLFKGVAALSRTDGDSQESLVNRLERLHEQAGVEWSWSSFALRCLGGGVAGGAMGFWGGWWLGVAGAIAGASVPLLALVMRRHTRRRKLCRQLPEAFQMISRAVRAGQTIPAALQIIANDFDRPISDEFARCYAQQNLGMSRESAFREMARRTGIMELQLFVVALLVQGKSGGDLVELLDNLAGMIRKRLKLKERVRALTGEGRMQAIVLTVLPFLALLGVIVLSPEYAKLLFDRPWLLIGTGIAQVIGILWIRHIVSFEY